MATGDKRMNIYDMRVAPEEGWDLHFFQFLDNKVIDSTRAAFLQSGVLDVDTIGITGPANDVFALDISNADRVIDGLGNIMDLTAYLSVFGLADVRSFFENTLATDYYVGIRYQEIPQDVERNPSSAEPEYPWYQDTIGEKGAPDNVTDNATYIRLEIDGILENGVDHSSRPVTVWLHNPVSPSDAIAYYTGAVGYAAGINYVDIPYAPGAGPLGQTTPTYPISTTALDYAVFIPGVSWFKNTDLSIDNNYAFIGKVTGAGAGNPPTVFDITGQRPVFLLSLDRAYRANSTDDPAPGRTIFADKGSVIVKQTASATRDDDDANTGLLFDGLDQDVVAFSFPFMTYLNEDASLSSSYSATRNLADGVDLLTIENITLTGATNTVVFTRGAADLTTFSADFLKNNPAFVYVQGTSNDQDGLYLIDASSIAAGSVDVDNLDGTSPTWTGDTGTARVLMLTDGMTPGDLHAVTSADQAGVFHYLAKDRDGFDITMYGEPVDKGFQRFLRIALTESEEITYFFNLYTARAVMRGGSSKLSYKYQDTDSVRGHAHWQSDKSGDNVGSTFAPLETDDEWGFDYRGNSFGKDTTSDYPPFQIAYSARIPFSADYAGVEHIHEEEAMTQASADTLTLTRGGVDATYLPADSVGAGGAQANAYILAEVQFDTPQAGDGVYLAYGATASTVTFRKFDGTAPSFSAGPGVVRFYGGCITGSPWGFSTGNAQGYVQSITPPTRWGNGSKWGHVGDDAYDTSQFKFFMFCQNLDNPGFSVRDGGQTFARALTTKGPTTGHGFTQWDMITTSLLHADAVNVLQGTRDIELPSTLGLCDVIKQDGGGSWTVTKVINIFKHAPSQDGAGVDSWSSVDGAAYLISALVDRETKIPFKMPQGATLSNIQIYVDPGTGGGTGASFGVEILRKIHAATTSTSLMSGGMQWAASGAAHNMTVTADQNRDIDNSTFTYWIVLRSSDAAVDNVYSAQAEYVISLFGEHFFDCF